MTAGPLRCATARAPDDDGRGTVVLDDGTTVAYDAEVVATSVFRTFRAGQRLLVRVDDVRRPTRVLAIGTVAAPPG